MARNGTNDDEKRIAAEVLQRDTGTDVQKKIRELNLEHAYSSLQLILGDDGTSGSNYAPPPEVPLFQRLLLLFSRSNVASFESFQARYTSFLVSKWRERHPKNDNPIIDIRFLEVDPWNYGKVYEETHKMLKTEISEGIDRRQIYFNLTPGTVTQEITLALIGKEMDGVQFIQVNKNRRDISVCDIPFDITVFRQWEAESIAREIIPEAESLFPDTPEGRAERRRLAAIARVDVDCLLTGDTGVGKNWIAERLLRKNSSRADKPFKQLNCATLGGDLNMMKSRLFGEKKGAHSTSHEDKPGLAKQADGGILFLDEIECLGPDAQSILLDFIQPREESKSTVRTFTPLGAKNEETTDVRIVSATNRPLWDMVRRGEFREDLYWRLAQLTFHVPSIANRVAQGVRIRGKSVIRHLIEEALSDFGKELNLKAKFSPEALEFLEGQNWPGNVRQLRNIVRRALVFAEGRVIDLAAVQRELRDGEPWGNPKTADQTDETPPTPPSSALNDVNASSAKPPAAPPTPPPSEEIDGLPVCREGETLGDAIDREVKFLRARYTRAAVAKFGSQSAAADRIGVSRATISKRMNN